ncbi:MAG: PAS domain-containing protein, partial [Desulfobacterales bacterium]
MIFELKEHCNRLPEMVVRQASKDDNTSERAPQAVMNTQKPSGAFRLRPGGLAVIAVLLVGVIMIAGYQSFKATEAATFNEFNQRQLVIAREAARGINLYFETLAGALNSVGRDSGVNRYDEMATRQLLEFEFHELQPMGVDNLGVMDANGVLRYTAVDRQLEGIDLSEQWYFQEAREMTAAIATYSIHFIELKEVEAGQKGIIVAAPMFETLPDKKKPLASAQFAGVVFCTLKLETLTQKFVKPIKSSERGHAFLINHEYNVLGWPDGNLIGKNLLNEVGGFPSFGQIVEKMIAGTSGTGKYRYYGFDEIVERHTKNKKEYLIAYVPLRLGKTLCALGVWAPTEDARKLIHSAYINQLFLVSVVILAILLGSGYTIVTFFRYNRSLAREVEAKTQEFKESHLRLLTVLDSLDASVYVADLETHAILFVNKYARDLFGDVVGKTCWQVFQTDRPGPCEFCTNEKLLTSDGEPAGVHIWEYQNKITDKWY